MTPAPGDDCPLPPLPALYALYSLRPSQAVSGPSQAVPRWFSSSQLTGLPEVPSASTGAAANGRII